jgi:hypothetical protein
MNHDLGSGAQVSALTPGERARAEQAGTVRLSELASVIRSKNAGPTQLTLDLFFRDADGFARAETSPALTADAVAGLYGLGAGVVQRFALPDIQALKFSLPRRVCAGSPGDGDVYGAQQHGPLLELRV